MVQTHNLSVLQLTHDPLPGRGRRRCESWQRTIRSFSPFADVIDAVARIVIVDVGLVTHETTNAVNA